MSIRVEHVSKRFGSFAALSDVSLDIPNGSLTALLGPSGSGKTTLLRILAGLEVPDRGRVWLDDEDVTDLPARDRGAGFVFQHYALFRHMTVFENIAFGMRIRRQPKGEITDRVNELLELVGLAGLGRRYPSQLSGGQRQRVALARALAASPRILLLDEPFGALDARVRQELRGWLRRLHEELHVTSVLVTHDQEEAFEVADRVVILHQGIIEQSGSPIEVWEQPASRLVLDFLGNINHFSGRVASGKAAFAGLELAYPAYGSPQPSPASVYVRPHEIELDREKNDHAIMAKVRHVVLSGSIAKVHLHAQSVDSPIQVELPRNRQQELGLLSGETVYLWPRAAHIFLQAETPESADDYSI